MSEYMLSRISCQLQDLGQNLRTNARPSGVPVSQYNELVDRFNRLSQSYTSNVDDYNKLRAYADYLEADVAALEGSVSDIKGARDNLVKIARECNNDHAAALVEIDRLKAIIKQAGL